MPRCPAIFATALGLAFGLGLVLTPPAGAQPSTPSGGAAGEVRGEILIVLASEAEGPVDPRLARVRALQRPPFSSYRSMELLSSPRVQLRPGVPHEVSLPNGRRMRLVLREITPQGRFRLQVSVNRPGQRDYLPEVNVVASPGDPFFIAGQSFRSGTLVIGIRLGERAAT